MGLKAFKATLYVLLTLTLLAALGLGFAYWRLMQGPISVGFLQATIEKAIGDKLPGFHLKLADAVLELDPDTHIPSVRARNVVLRDGTGEMLAASPKAGVTLDKSEILRGRIVVRAVELIGPSINARRNLDGSLELGIGEAAAAADEAVVVDEKDMTFDPAAPQPDKAPARPMGGRLLELLGGAGESANALANLDDFQISRASLRVYDEANDATWMAPKADFAFKRMPYGFLVVAKADVASGGDPWHAELSATYRRAEGDILLNAAVADVVPANVADQIFALSQFARFKMPLSGRIEIAMNTKVGVRKASGELFAAAGELNFPDYFAKPVLVEEGAIRFNYDGAGDVVKIADSSILVGGARVDVSGTLKPVRTPDGRLSELAIDVVAKSPAVEAKEQQDRTVDIDRIEFKGAAGVEDQRVRIDDLVVMADETGVRLRGVITGGEESAGIQVAGRMRDVSAELLKRLWPPIMTPKTRAWIADNVLEGRITEGTFQVNFPVNELARTMNRRVMQPGAVDLAFKMDGVTTKYFKDLPPLIGASGSARLVDKEFNLVIDGGGATLESGEKISLVSGSFRAADILQQEVDGDFQFDVQGPVKSMLAFAAHPDLDMAPADTSAAANLEGTAHALIKLQMPLIKGVPKSRVSIDTKVGVTEAKVANIAPGVDMTGGKLAVDVTPENIVVSGPAKLNGVASDILWTKPRGKGEATAEIETVVDSDMRKKLGLNLDDYMSGDVPVKLKLGAATDEGREILVEADLAKVTMKLAAAGWSRKPTKGTRATFRVLDKGKGNRKVSDIRIDGPGLTLRGDVVIKGNEVASIKATHIKLEEDDTFTATLSPGDGVMNLQLTGTSIDARPYIKNLVSPAKSPEPGTQPPKGQNFVVDARFDKVFANRGEELTDVKATFVTKRGAITTAKIEGLFRSGKPLTIRLTPTEAGRELKVASYDGGAVLRSTDFYGKIAGGQLEFSALIGNEAGGPIRNGRLVIEGFEVRNEAALAQLDSRGKPKKSGPRRDGLYFQKLILPFSSDSQFVRLCKVQLRGSEVGATASGLIRKKDGAIDITGSYIPAYGLNSALGQIPIIGDLLGKREGILGITYAMGGTMSKPDYQINPLSILAPGILRKLFEYEQDACRIAPRKSLRLQSNNN